MIRVLFFGPIAECIGTREMQLDHAEGMRLQDLLQQFAVQHPAALGLVSFIALNQTQVRDTQTVLRDNDEVALMAKFSGG